MRADKMNGSINVLKFVFAVMIMLLHGGTFFGYDRFEWFQGAFIYVEWFYIFIGYMLAKKVLRMEKGLPLWETTAGVVKSRLIGLIPFYFISCGIALALKMSTGQVVVLEGWHVHMIVFEFLMMQMTTLSIIPLTDVSWFLSSMWIALVILTPLILLLRRKFTRCAILITIALYLYMAKETGTIYNPSKWLDLSYKGNLRAVAAICLGMTSYELGEWIRPKLRHPKVEDAVTLVFYVAIAVYTFFWEESRLTNAIYFIIPFVFMVLVAVQMSKQQQNLIPDNRVTRFLGKFSMALFMNHAYILKTIATVHPEIPIFQGMLIGICGSLCTALCVYFLGNLLMKMPALIRKGQKGALLAGKSDK